MNNMRYLYTLTFLLLPFLIQAQQTPSLKTVTISDDLKLIQISDQVWIHRSYMTTEEFGRISANGIIYINNSEALVGDTPTNEAQSVLLLDWLKEQEVAVKAVVVNHHHVDAVGGLQAFHKHSIPSYGHTLTQDLTEDVLLKPWHTFSDSMALDIGSETIKAYYFGKGHTDDNIALWIPEEQTLFGGCLVKSLKAGKGYLGDATVEDWPNTIKNIQQYFPEIKTVIPGHGAHGNTDLLDATIRIISN